MIQYNVMDHGSAIPASWDNLAYSEQGKAPGTGGQPVPHVLSPGGVDGLEEALGLLNNIVQDTQLLKGIDFESKCIAVDVILSDCNKAKANASLKRAAPLTKSARAPWHASAFNKGMTPSEM